MNRSGRRKKLNKSWTPRLLRNLVKSYVEMGCQSKWAVILATHPNDFGSFDSNDIGIKARKMGLTACTTAKECNKCLDDYLKSHSRLTRPLTSFGAIDGGNRQHQQMDFDDEEIDDDDEDMNEKDMSPVEEEFPAKWSFTGGQTTSSSSSAKVSDGGSSNSLNMAEERTVFTPSSVAEKPVVPKIHVPFAPHVVDKKQYMLVCFVRVPGVTYELEFPTDHSFVISMSRKPLTEEVCKEIVTMAQDEEIPEVRNLDVNKVFTSALSTSQTISLPFEVVPSESRVKTSLNLVGFYLKKKQHVTLNAEETLEFRKSQ